MPNRLEQHCQTRYGNVSKNAGNGAGGPLFPRQQAGRMAAGGKRDRGMTRRVEGKVALVTGAANGIGRSAALLLARDGAKIVATDLQDEQGQSLLRALRAFAFDCAY